MLLIWKTVMLPMLVVVVFTTMWKWTMGMKQQNSVDPPDPTELQARAHQ